jgi:hypothetical protein
MPEQAHGGTIPRVGSFHLSGPLASFSAANAKTWSSHEQEWERPMTDPHERPVVTEANKEAVRAGHTGDHLRYILLGGCALVIIGFVLVALLGKV